MGRAWKAAQTGDLARLFPFFGLEAEPELVVAHRTAIATRFSFEVQEIVRLCSGLRERERYSLFREALRLAYESAVRDAAPRAESTRGPPGGQRSPPPDLHAPPDRNRRLGRSG